MLKIFKRCLNTNRFVPHLQSQKASELKMIAINCGVACSGTKSELIDRLSLHFSNASNEPLSRSILSFDVGYRNLAYCILDSDAKIVDWARVDLELPGFHPSVVAPIIRQFVRSLDDRVRGVDRVLVERQRARTGGGHAVLEVTLRVNCVEALLWCSLMEVTELRPVPMTPIPRQIVDRVWQSQLVTVIGHNPALQSLRSKTTQKKRATASLVQHWLETNTVVDCSQELKDMFYKEKKQDDLGDCLLQALTWYEWEKYSQQFISKTKK
ncbi:MAG: ribonuclease H-like domain-containing protein [Benjaminiella poitrasii]|nr:MAG: ribonuclease H-like domain-containing protein [Benjaminiella poitrasii]